MHIWLAENVHTIIMDMLQCSILLPRALISVTGHVFRCVQYYIAMHHKITSDLSCSCALFMGMLLSSDITLSRFICTDVSKGEIC